MWLWSLIMCMRADACMGARTEIEERLGHADRDTRRECATLCYVRHAVSFWRLSIHWIHLLVNVCVVCSKTAYRDMTGLQFVIKSLSMYVAVHSNLSGNPRIHTLVTTSRVRFDGRNAEVKPPLESFDASSLSDVIKCICSYPSTHVHLLYGRGC